MVWYIAIPLAFLIYAGLGTAWMLLFAWADKRYPWKEKK